MFCNQCGSQNPDNSRFCSSCGNILSADLLPDKSTQKTVTTKENPKDSYTAKHYLENILNMELAVRHLRNITEKVIPSEIKKLEIELRNQNKDTQSRNARPRPPVYTEYTFVNAVSDLTQNGDLFLKVIGGCLLISLIALCFSWAAAIITLIVLFAAVITVYWRIQSKAKITAYEEEYSNYHRKVLPEYEERKNRAAKAPDTRSITEAKITRFGTELKSAVIDLRTAENLLDIAYSENIIPKLYRGLHPVYFLREYMTINPARTLDEALNQCVNGNFETRVERLIKSEGDELLANAVKSAKDSGRNQPAATENDRQRTIAELNGKIIAFLAEYSYLRWEYNDEPATICEQCGREITRGMKFCSECSTQSSNSTPTAYRSSAQPSAFTLPSSISSISWKNLMYCVFGLWAISMLFLFSDWVSADAYLATLEYGLFDVIEMSPEVSWMYIVSAVTAILMAVTFALLIKKDHSAIAASIAASVFLSLHSVFAFVLYNAATDSDTFEGELLEYVITLTAAPYILLIISIVCIIIAVIAKNNAKNIE